jgi:hypothetical protein
MKITLLHQDGISNYCMRKMHGQTTPKSPYIFMEPKVHYWLTSVHQCSEPYKSTSHNQLYFLNQLHYYPPIYDYDTHAAVIIL